jgi:hypothetical protein
MQKVRHNERLLQMEMHLSYRPEKPFGSAKLFYRVDTFYIHIIFVVVNYRPQAYT